MPLQGSQATLLGALPHLSGSRVTMENCPPHVTVPQKEAGEQRPQRP